MQEQLRFHRQIIYDLATHYLEPLPGNFARLAYLASLRDTRDGVYRHDRLSAVYGVERVHQTLSKCHEELLERLLELPLARQEEDLRGYLNSLPGGIAGQAKVLRKEADWASPNSPAYLRELFRANLAALLELLAVDTPRARSDR